MLGHGHCERDCVLGVMLLRLVLSIDHGQEPWVDADQQPRWPMTANNRVRRSSCECISVLYCPIHESESIFGGLVGMTETD